MKLLKLENIGHIDLLSPVMYFGPHVNYAYRSL